MSSNSAETTIEGSFESEGTGVNISQCSPIPGPTSSTASVARRRPVRCDQWLSTFVTNAVDAYCKELKESPIRTKAITSCAISMLGELIGTALKPRKPDGSRETVSVRRMAVFAGYGLFITGPFFHWWYGSLERGVSSLDLTSSYFATLIKVAITQLVMTPPFLVFTLAYIKYFLSFDAKETVAMVKRTYAAALLTNWKVWTVAQAVNFQLVPLEYRVLFGNMIALWWNIYLSVTSHNA